MTPADAPPEFPQRSAVPPYPWLVVLLALAVLPPFVAQFLGTPFGAFAMFRRLERYQLRLHVLEAGQRRELPLRALRPHLSREAARVLLPAQGTAVGADQVPIVQSALPDLAHGVCALYPRVARVEFTLRRAAMTSDRFTEHQVIETCER